MSAPKGGRKAKNAVLRETGLENRSRPENRWIRLEIALRALFSKCRNPKIPKKSTNVQKGSENPKIVRKMSETGLERSSRALDKSGCVKKSS